MDAYKKAIAFIDKYGHAYISNGPFFISKIDTTANYLELSAYRKGYPYKKDYWPKFFALEVTQIDNVNVPANAQRAADTAIDLIRRPVHLSRATSPNPRARKPRSR